MAHYKALKELSRLAHEGKVRNVRLEHLDEEDKEEFHLYSVENLRRRLHKIMTDFQVREDDVDAASETEEMKKEHSSSSSDSEDDDLESVDEDGGMEVEELIARGDFFGHVKYTRNEPVSPFEQYTPCPFAPYSPSSFGRKRQYAPEVPTSSSEKSSRSETPPSFGRKRKSAPEVPTSPSEKRSRSETPPSFGRKRKCAPEVPTSPSEKRSRSESPISDYGWKSLGSRLSVYGQSSEVLSAENTSSTFSGPSATRSATYPSSSDSDEDDSVAASRRINRCRSI